ncbi:hypothetical protein C4564_05885 [Candidatus Microgenomates bacterium]|nr:MAG: hypothetical protein C4564_05885 [Candidatus Microgenomates bacterium]
MSAVVTELTPAQVNECLQGDQSKYLTITYCNPDIDHLCTLKLTVLSGCRRSDGTYIFKTQVVGSTTTPTLKLQLLAPNAGYLATIEF